MYLGYAVTMYSEYEVLGAWFDIICIFIRSTGSPISSFQLPCSCTAGVGAASTPTAVSCSSSTAVVVLQRVDYVTTQSTGLQPQHWFWHTGIHTKHPEERAKERRSTVRRDARSTESSRTRTWYVLESYYCCTLLIERQVAPGVRRSV